MGGVDWGRVGAGAATMGMSELARPDPYGIDTGKSGGGGKGAPEPPNFREAAEAQARGDHANQNTPWGSSTWTEGENGQWSQQYRLAPGLQGGFDNLTAQIGQQGPLPSADATRDQVVDSAYQQHASRLNPQWSQRREGLQSQLANQGLDLGSEAYDNAMGNFSRSENDAYTSAMADAIRQGTTASAVQGEQNRQNAMVPYQQLGAIRNISTMPATPGGADYLQAAGLGYQGQLNQYGTQQAGKNSLMSGAASLAPLLAL